MKHIYKVIPVSLFDIPGVEAWLEGLANEGLFPVHLGSYASFNREGKPGTRFRLEPFGRSGSTPAPEQLDLYREMGWEYALKVGRAFHLFYSTDPAALEPHTDPVIKAHALDVLAKKVRRAKWHHILYPILFPLILLLPTIQPASRFDAQPERWASLPLILVSLCHPAFLFFLATLLFTYGHELKEFKLLLELHNRLKEGLDPKPSPGPSRAMVRYNTALILLLPFALLFFLWAVLPNTFNLALSTPLAEFKEPYVSLQSLEDETLWTYEELFEGTPRQKQNYVERDYSLLARTWYTVDQKSYSAQDGTTGGSSPNPDGGKHRYSPSLDMTYIHLRIPALARPVAESLLDRMRLINLWWEYEEVSHPGTDFVILAHCGDNPWKMAALAKGGKVAVFRYGGQELLDNHLDTLCAMVN